MKNHRKLTADVDAEDLAFARELMASGIQWEEISQEIDKATARGEEADVKAIVQRLKRRREKPAPPVYRSRPTNGRRTRADMEIIREAIYNLLAEDNPMTVRQVFYRLVVAAIIAKTEMEYKATVGRLLTEMRLSGRIPFGWIADNTRWMRKPRTYSSMEEALRRTAETYRRSLWDNQNVYVEVWLEKEALAGVLVEETDPWDVPLMVTRGYPSLSYLYEAASAIAALNKPAYLYYFGDYDPSGVDITRNVEERLRQFAPKAEIHFHRVAVTTAQIEAWELPTRPTKKTDSRSRSFDGESVEVDAIHPRQLRALSANCIQRHLDRSALETMRVAEESEREILERLTKRIGKQKPSVNGKR